ncbi:MAG TPA: protein kinase [Gammaproteobacteria bacterium]|nr:protein kinase [Gammaproteobacteria bacterium]
MPARILIIDDHRDYRAWLGHHLAAAQPDARITAHDPAGGNPLPADFAPGEWDLLFIDHELGGRDGLALLAELKSGPDCPPVVFLSPQGDQDTAVRALKAGADDYLAKGPSSQAHIGRVMREALRRGRQSSAHGGQLPDGQSRDGRSGDGECRDGRSSGGQSRGGQSPGGAVANVAPGLQLKGYRFLETLGTGSTASVHLVEKIRGERLVVVKVFRQVPDRVETQIPLERFLREYQVVSGIRHPSVVQIFDLGIADDMAYIAMEYFAGGQFGEHIGTGLPQLEALDALAQVAAALEAIHGVGVLHRDLKPANIMLRADGSLALIDFGVAKLRDASAELSRLGEIFGTPYYMSPEQGEGAPVDERADIYSLGVVFHEMLTGRKPYIAGSPMAIIQKHCHAPRPELPPALSACQPLLASMMAIDPAERPPSARAVLDAVNPLRARLASPAAAPR